MHIQPSECMFTVCVCVCVWDNRIVDAGVVCKRGAETYNATTPRPPSYVYVCVVVFKSNRTYVHCLVPRDECRLVGAVRAKDHARYTLTFNCIVRVVRI